MDHRDSHRSQRIMSRPVDSLYDAALAPATLRMYNKNLNKLLSHTRLTLTQLLSLSHSRIDRLVSKWIEHLDQSGGSFDYAAQCLHGLIFHCPVLRLKHNRTRMCLRGWSRIRETRSHPPMTWELTVMFAMTVASWDYHSGAVATLVSFDCLLRVGEVSRMVAFDVIMPHNPRVGDAHPTMALRLPRTKTGLNQWVSLNNPVIASVLEYFIQSRSLRAQDRVFPFSPGQFNRLLHLVASSLGVGHIPYVAHSFRHGGATCAYLAGATIEQIVYRGRWRRLESARRYIQTGPALMATWPIPSRLNRAGRTIATELLPAMIHLLETVPLHQRPARYVHFQK
jgi:integrase